MIKITVPSRIHITLFELGTEGYRRNGGIGFSIDRPSVQLSFAKHHQVSVDALDTIGFSLGEITALTEKVEAAKCAFNFTSSLRLTHVSSVGRHVGFGSGTAIALALIEALGLLNGREFDRSTISRLSGRGGTSGIGINTYFSGGFVFDAGRKFDDLTLQSSDDISIPVDAPLVVIRHDMPDWPIGVFTPEDLTPISIESERNLFSSKLPLAMRQVESAIYHGLMGALVAVVAGDYTAFCRAINNIQKCEWKQQEIALSSPTLSTYLSALYGLGCDAVGVSSLGPSIYFLSKNMSTTLSSIKSAFPNSQVDVVASCNTGRKIEYV